MASMQTGFPIIHSSTKQIAFPQTYTMEPNIVLLCWDAKKKHFEEDIINFHSCLYT